MNRQTLKTIASLYVNAAPDSPDEDDCLQQLFEACLNLPLDEWRYQVSAFGKPLEAIETIKGKQK